jgi:RNA polymerase sigma-B factor
MNTREVRLFEHYRASRDPACREALVTRYLPLARSLAGRYARGGEPFDDLFQVASFALLKAIDRYDPSRGIAFSSYAVPTILGELKRHYRDTTWMLRIPHSVHDLAMHLRKTREWLAGVHGRQPTVAELAEASGASEEAVLEALGALTANEIISLQSPSDDDRDGTLADELGGAEAGYSRVEQRALLEDLCRCLTPREQRVVALRFDEDLTQREIGKRLGVSQMAVSRVLRAALPRLCESAERNVRAG